MADAPTPDEQRLYDRQDHIDRLDEAYRQVKEVQPDRDRLVLITGPSGTGKTALALTLRRPERLLITGKFDQLQQHVGSYLPFRQAMTEFVRLQLAREACRLRKRERPESGTPAEDPSRHGKEQDETHCTALRFFRKAIQGDEELLKHMIPGLAQLLQEDSSRRQPDELNYLTHLVPATCCSFSSKSEAPEEFSMNDSGVSAARSGFALRRLMRAIGCLQSEPAVLFLDDLQWADSESLSLLRDTLLDNQLMSNWLVVGACRGNEVSYHGELSNVLREMEDQHSVRIREVCVKNLALDGIHSLLEGELFASVQTSGNSFVNDDKDVNGDPQTMIRSVAKYLHRQTQGNLFATTHLMRVLIESGALQVESGDKETTKEEDESGQSAGRSSYSQSSPGRITWDPSVLNATLALDHISEEDTSSGTKILDPVWIVSARISLLEPEILKVLKIASCFGAIVDLHLLQIAMVKPDHELDEREDRGATDVLDYMQDTVTIESLMSSIQQAVQLGFLQEMQQDGSPGLQQQSKRYKFVHDKVQQAAYDLMASVDDAHRAHLQIGTSLWYRLKLEELQENAVLVASQLERCFDLINTNEDRASFCELCLRAADNLKSNESDFKSALSYVEMGISALSSIGGRHWRDHYETSLRAYSMAAELSKVVGDHEKTFEYVQSLLLNARSTLDRVRGELILMLSFGSQNRLGEALDLAVNILSHLGEPMPKRIGYARFKYECARFFDKIKGLSDGDILRLPKMTDPTKAAAIVTLNHAYLYGYYHHPMFSAVASMRNVLLTLKYGLVTASADGFAVLSISMVNLLCQFGMGCRFGALSFRVLQRLNSRQGTSRLLNATFGNVFMVQKPTLDCLSPLVDAFRIGMQEGDTEIAMLAMQYHTTNSLWAGVPLKPLYGTAKETLERMIEYQYIHFKNLQLPYLQFMANFLEDAQMRANDVRPSVLKGGFCREDVYLENAHKEQEESQIVQIHSLKLLGDVIMSDFASAYPSLSMIRKLGRKSVHPTIDSASHFLEALIVYATMPEKSLFRNHRELHRAKASLKVLDRYAQEAPFNQQHRVLLLKAERSRLTVGSRGSDAAWRMYQSAQRSAKASGCLWEEALIYERSAEHLSRSGHNGREMLVEARRLYKQWGASAKVAELDKQLEK